MTQQQPAVSSLVLAIMGLLSEQPMSGYDIRKLFASTAMGHFSDSPGAIYPALKRCEKNGWIKGKVQNPRSLRPRRVFSLTRSGRAVLTANRTQPITRDDIMRRSEELILRFAFIGESLGPNRARAYVQEYLREVEAYLSELRAHAKTTKDDMTIYGRLSMELGIEGYELNARWARRVLKELA
jgi:DNA-binding PadR family transcriptional regulator